MEVQQHLQLAENRPNIVELSAASILKDFAGKLSELSFFAVA